MKYKSVIIVYLLTISVLPENVFASVCDNKSSVDCIRERGKIIAGVRTDIAPFGEERNGVIEGFDIDIIRAFAHCWFNDDSDAKVKLVPISAGDRLEVLANRDVDLVAAAMTRTHDRDKHIDFSNVYFTDGQRMIVKRTSELSRTIGTSDTLDSFINSLNNKIISVVQKTTSLNNIRSEMERHDVTVRYRIASTWDEAIDLLKKGLVDIVTTDGVILDRYAKKEQDLKVIGLPFSTEPYAIGVHEGDTAFTRLINITLQKIYESGEYEFIFRKWFPDGTRHPHKLDTFPGKLNMEPFDDSCRRIEKQSDSQCNEYIVKHGDTLTGLAKDHLFGSNQYLKIYRDNKERIGSNPDLIEVGTKLQICHSSLSDQ